MSKVRIALSHTAIAPPLLLGLGAARSAEEPADPHALHEQNCIQCHQTDVYTRADRKVTSYVGLGRQVRRCETALGLRWFDEEIDAMTRYLNREFYRLTPGQ